MAAQWMGWENVFQVEIDSYCQKVLQKNFPNVKRYGDIRDTDFTIYRGLNILSAGFPCQSFSLAGKRGNDLTYWKQTLRAVKEIEPDFFVGENVYGILSAGNGDTINIICSDLEAAGYEKPILFDCTADAFDLPTLERHIWIITKTNRKRQEGQRILKMPDHKEQRKLQRSYKGEHHRWNLPESRVLCVGKRIPGELDAVAAYGNAIPPKVAYEIFKAIEKSQGKLELKTA